MREIKFKCWDNKNKIIFKPLAISFSDYSTCYQDAKTGNMVYLIKDQYILIQYTGLHDKNGVEIAEGDIVEFYYKQYVVEWFDKSACFRLKGDRNIRKNFIISTAKQLKVIDNIYDVRAKQ